jgi:hypothetical protein
VIRGALGLGAGGGERVEVRVANVQRIHGAVGRER